MKRVLTIVAAIAVASACAFGAVASMGGGPSTEELTEDIRQIDIQIANAEAEASKYGEGSALHTQTVFRREVLKATKAMLEQKRASWLRGISLSYTVEGQPLRPAAPEVIDKIQQEIKEASAKAEIARQKAALYSGGLIQATLLIEEGTHRLTEALGTQRLALAKLGATLPTAVPLAKENPSDAKVAPATSAASAAAPSATEAQPAKPPGIQWYVTEDKSPIDDSRQVYASLSSTDKINTLGIRCKGKSVEAYVATRDYLGSDESVRVLVRFDQDRAQEGVWHQSSSGKGAFVPNAEAFISGLQEDGKLFVRLWGYGGRTSDSLFELGKISAPVQRVADACGWSRPTKPAAPANGQ